jgi:phosphoglycolate phosphatase-like HAD superfamily hydrolase
MKVIFLDHDGVICLSNNWGGRSKKQKKYGRKMSQGIDELPVDVRFDNFDKKAIDVLNSILEETSAEIVVSSDWKRWATVEELGEYYEQQGIIKKPIDVTPFFRTLQADGKIPGYEDFVWDRNEQLEQERHFEILDWLKNHSEVTHWVAVDDLNMGIPVSTNYYGDFDREWGLTNFVWTPQMTEGIKQSGKKEKILELLK